MNGYHKGQYNWQDFETTIDGEYIVDVSQNISLKDLYNRLSSDSLDEFRRKDGYFDSNGDDNEEFVEPPTDYFEAQEFEENLRLSRLNKSIPNGGGTPPSVTTPQAGEERSATEVAKRTKQSEVQSDPSEL